MTRMTRCPRGLLRFSTSELYLNLDGKKNMPGGSEDHQVLRRKAYLGSNPGLNEPPLLPAASVVRSLKIHVLAIATDREKASMTKVSRIATFDVVQVGGAADRHDLPILILANNTRPQVDNGAVITAR